VLGFRVRLRLGVRVSVRVSIAYVRNSGPESWVHYAPTEVSTLLKLYMQAGGASRASVLKPRTTGATSDDLKLQCVAFFATSST